MKTLIWYLIRAYQLTLSAMFGRHCRFQPTCSHYAQQAIMRHGVLTGGLLAVRRIARCHPWGGSGFDPVPEQVVKGPRCNCHAHK